MGDRVHAAFKEALRVIRAALSPGGIDWALTGSTSFALQGVPITPADIDIQTDEPGAYAIARLLAAYVVRPVVFSRTEQVCSHFGGLVIAGVAVEVMGALQKRLPDGVWEPPVNVVQHRRWITFEGRPLPVLDLAYEIRAYRLMGRHARAADLARFLSGTAEQEH
jgi:hypothetical protein